MSISGVGVAIVGTGALLIYAGLQNENPLTAFKEIATGKPKGVSTTSTSTAPTSIDTSNYNAGQPGSPGNGKLSGLALVAYDRYGSDQYSQGKRTQEGYSDCSSFVDKAIRAYAVPNFPWLVTGGFLFSPDWVTVGAEKARPGDVAVNGSHMAIVGGRNSKGELIGVGQQNPRRNVQIDTMKNLMYGTGGYLIRRYKKYDLSGATSAKKVQGGQGHAYGD